VPRRHWHLRIVDMLDAGREMRDMRNFIVHEYFGLNREVLWGTVSDDLPALIPVLRRMLQNEDPGSVH
jgi:uncharacterized protein with HEPN domain